MPPVFLPSPTACSKCLLKYFTGNPLISYRIVCLYITSNLLKHLYSLLFPWRPAVDEASIIPVIQMWKLNLQRGMLLVRQTPQVNGRSGTWWSGFSYGVCTAWLLFPDCYFMEGFKVLENLTYSDHMKIKYDRYAYKMFRRVYGS